MAYEWYKDQKKVIELAEFIVETDQITTAKELLDYFKHPDKYTEVWRLYQEEILGKSSSHRLDSKASLPVMLALITPTY
jgi:hypothetical protein